MIKNISLICLGLFFVVGLSGCQSNETVKAPDLSLPVVNAESFVDEEPSKTEADLKINNEVSLIEALAKHDQAVDFNKYQLHDVIVSGDYARGRFSCDNELRTDIFWATMSAGVWHLVFLGDQGPDCAILNGFPIELKSGCREDLNVKQISNFADCLKAGFLATNDQPRRCFDDKNNVFVEVGMVNLSKRYISQDVAKCRDLDFDCTSTERSFLDDFGCGCQK